MAPVASGSRSRRRDPSPSSSDEDGDNANGAHGNVDGLNLSHPDKTCKHLFLQTLVNRKVMTLDIAKEIYDECVRVCSVQQADSLETFIARLEPQLSLCGLDIKITRDQETGTGMYVLVNTIQDEPAKVATEYKAEEIAYFKAIVEKIVTAPRLSYSVTQTDAVRCAKAPMTRGTAIQVMKSFIAKGWLSLHSSGRLVLSPRSLLELSPYLRETFKDEDDEGDPHNRAIGDCSYCLNIVTSGYACPSEDCGIRLHTFCVGQQVQDGRCPDRLNQDKAHPCQQIWPRDANSRKYHGTPIGVAALAAGGSDDEDDAGTQVGPTSEMDVDTPATGKKGRKAASGKGRKGKKARVEEDEEEEDELEGDETEEESNPGTSPAARRKSSRAPSKRKVVAQDSDEEEE
ncbi:hypothetical protein JCM10207_008028 [Rhodosporidiobolus poonsookiae]